MGIIFFIRFVLKNVNYYGRSVFFFLEHLILVGTIVSGKKKRKKKCNEISDETVNGFVGLLPGVPGPTAQRPVGSTRPPSSSVRRPAAAQ